MKKRKIGVLIRGKIDTDYTAEFEKAKALELDSCQLCVWDANVLTAEYAEKVNMAAEKTGITISGLWAGWAGPCEWNFSYGPSTIGLVPAAYRFDRLKQLEKACNFALMIHTDCVITHVGFLPENPADPDYVGTVGALRYLCQKMKKTGLRFLFETGQETPVTMLRTIEMIGTDNVGINFDTANLMLYGKANAVDAVRVFGKYIVDTHIKDGLFPTDGQHLGKQVPVGEGLADFPKLIPMLEECGYEGPYTIEREISGEQQIIDIRNARDYLRALFKEIDG